MSAAYFEKIPAPIFHIITFFASDKGNEIQQLNAMRQVCKAWKKFIEDPVLIALLIKRYNPNIDLKPTYDIFVLRHLLPILKSHIPIPIQKNEAIRVTIEEVQAIQIKTTERFSLLNSRDLFLGQVLLPQKETQLTLSYSIAAPTEYYDSEKNRFFW